MLNPHFYLDVRNQGLWDDLNKIYNISLQHSGDDIYGCFSQNSKAIIFVGKNLICKDSFTHELLHIYLKSKEIYIGGNITNLVRTDQNLEKIFSDDLLDHISNCLDHIKMLPIYLRMGFNREKFLSDYYTAKCSDIEISKIRMNINLIDRWQSAADLYLGKFFAMKACANLTYNYNQYLDQLGNIDENLYNILNQFWTSWENYDIENYDAIFNSYRDLSSLFIESISNWALSK